MLLSHGKSGAPPPLLHRRAPRLRGRVSLARLVHYPAASPVSSVFAIPWKQICCKIGAAFFFAPFSQGNRAPLSFRRSLDFSVLGCSVGNFSFSLPFRGIVIKRLRVTLMVHGRCYVSGLWGEFLKFFSIRSIVLKEILFSLRSLHINSNSEYYIILITMIVIFFFFFCFVMQGKMVIYEVGLVRICFDKV